MSTKHKVYITATVKHSYQDGYDEAFPYDITLQDRRIDCEHCWCLGSMEVDVADQSIQHVIQCQIHGLEQAIKNTKQEAYDNLSRQEEKLDNLLALPAPQPLEEA